MDPGPVADRVKPAQPIAWALAGLATAAILVALVQASGRADRAVAAAQTRSAKAPVVETPRSVTLNLDVGADQNVLAQGWSGPEPGLGVWSLGHEARLDLPTPCAPGDLDLALTFQAFLAPGLPAQRVRIESGGARLADWRITTAAEQTRRIRVPAALRTTPGLLQLRLELPDADSPAHRSPDASDPRVIAIMLKTVELRPLAGQPPPPQLPARQAATPQAAARRPIATR